MDCPPLSLLILDLPSSKVREPEDKSVVRTVETHDA